MSKLLTVAVAPKLSEDEINGVLQLMADAEAVDHMKALNEAAVLRLRRRHPTTQHLQVSAEDRLLGIGSLLLQRLIMESSSPLRVWAMGDTPAARALAATAGMVPRRKLLIMERQLDDEVPEPVMPPGVQIRTFVPGQDEQEWLRVNAAAFADHPEQALIDSDDLADRMAESWFDPNGFFVATINDTMVGFHWTKQHQDQLGEVYVLGIAPSAAGGGLGKALLLTGLRSLQERGSTRVELYVEADNRAAIELYLSYGFATVSRDVMYAQG